MLNVLLSMGALKIYSFGVLALLGFLSAFFVMWKKATEYHLENNVFLDIFISVFMGGLVAGRIVYIVINFNDFGWNIVKWLWLTHYVGISFWGALLGMIITLWWLAKEGNYDLFKHLDLLSLGLSLGLVFGNIGALLNGNYQYLPIPITLAVLSLVLFIWLWWLEHEYRTIVWYRGSKNSAQTGFMWFWFLIWLGLAMTVVGLINRNYESILGGITLTTGLFGIYGRSGRNPKGDLLDLKKRFGLH